VTPQSPQRGPFEVFFVYWYTNLPPKKYNYSS
jgi:hypothetical protein